MPAAHSSCVLDKSPEARLQYTLCTLFESGDTDAVLLIDASNAFNALKRAAALHNIRILRPIIAIYANNAYRQPARLFVIGGKEIV